MHAADDSLCDNGLFCDGVEACDGLLGCLPGTAPNCDDAIVCTIDFCGEQVGQCIQTADHAACDDGVFCNGTELCDLVIGCVAAVISACDDGIGCTIDSCDENNQLCQHTPEHASCDDGFFCNGAELCGASGCTAGLPPCESENFCEEKLNQCAAPPTNCISDIDCDDANLCTDNHCVAGVCEEDFNGLPCDDGNACTTNDTCRSGSCTGEAIANCGAPPIDPGPGGTGPPTVDPPDEVEPPGIDEAPETDPEDPEESENEPQPEPPAGSPSGPCQHGEPCDDEPAQSQDSDADGVLDAEDLCPSTPAEQRTDVSGCGTDEPTPGRGTWVIEDARRCGACGAMGSIGVFIMVCVPGTVLVLGRPRGRKFIRLKCSASDHAACRRAPK